MEYGYARMSSKDQKAEEQVKALKGTGIAPKNIFVDNPGEKEKFHLLKDSMSQGDVLVVNNLSQLGYTYNEILKTWVALTKEHDAHIRVLDMDLLDTTIKRKGLPESFVSDLFLQVITFISEQERAYIKRKQAEGMALAKERGKHLGRPSIPKPENFNEMYDRWRSGEISAIEAMILMGLKRSTFERFVKERKGELKKK
jgi:DNA invertase Pin-like site-specific DNA recombinase